MVRLSSENICNEDAAQTISFQSQAVPTKKKMKKSQNFKIWLQKCETGNPARDQQLHETTTVR